MFKTLHLAVVTLLFAPHERPAPSVPPFTQPPATVVGGRVLRTGGAPVSGATIELFETEERTVTDSVGRFRLSTTWTGPATLVARVVGATPVARDIVLPRDSVVTFTVERSVPRLTPIRVLPAGEFRLANTATTEPLSPIDIVQTPGAAANVARALQIAPGVNAVDEGTGLFVRGGDVTETRVLVDGVTMLSPARFANPTGHVGATLNPFLLSNAVLAAGAFGAAYGNALSGIVRMETAGRPSRSTGSLSASIGSASANAALALTPRFGMRALASMNNLGPLVAVFGEAQPYDPPPRGGDASLMMEYATGKHSRLRAFGVRQRQQFGVGASDLDVASRYAATTREDLTVISWRDTASSWQPSLAWGRSRFGRNEQLSSLDLSTVLANDHVVATVRRTRGDRFVVTMGAEHERFTARYGGTSGADRTTLFDNRTPTVRTAAFAESNWRMGLSTVLTTGARADRSDFTGRTTFDPRVSFATQRGTWGIVASAGLYSQIPEPILVRRAVAEPMRVTQGTIAVQRGDTSGARLRVEGYWRRWRALAQFTPSFDVVSGGTGEAVGVDSELRWQFGRRARARLVWSMLDAHRTDPRTGVRAPAPTSITHSVILLTEREIRRLSLSTALRYASGRPFTDIVGRTGAAPVQPVFGAPNAERLPGYWRSDLSASWLLARAEGPTTVLWASVSNVFDRRNIMRYTWDSDYVVRTPVRSPFNRSIYVGATLLLP